MISSGWRKVRKVIKGRNIIITANRILNTPDVDTIYTIIDNSELKKPVNDWVRIYQQIKISECSNYDFNDCNIYIEGLEKDFSENTIKDIIRNCLFFNCTIIAKYEKNIQFRYCVMTDVKFDVRLDNLDFSGCVLNSIQLGRKRKEYNEETKTIYDQLTFNSITDDKAILSINNFNIYGRVNWIWFYGTHMITLKSLTIESDDCTDIACEDEDFIYGATKDKLINVVNDDYTIHDYAEEREERGFPSYFVNSELYHI